MSELETAVVNAKGAARIGAGHPWVFRPEVVRGPKNDASDGGPSLVRVLDGRGRPLGVATWAAHPRLALRIVAREGEPEPTDLVAVRTALQAAGIDYDSAEASFIASVNVALDEDGARKVFRLIEALEDSDDVQNVFGNFDIPDDVLAELDA